MDPRERNPEAFEILEQKTNVKHIKDRIILGLGSEGLGLVFESHNLAHIAQIIFEYLSRFTDLEKQDWPLLQTHTGHNQGVRYYFSIPKDETGKTLRRILDNESDLRKEIEENIAEGDFNKLFPQTTQEI